MDPQKPPSWESFHPIGGEPAAYRSKPSDYVWLLIGAAFAGAILCGLIYVGFEFWRHNELRRYHDTLWEMAHASAMKQQITVDEVERRVGISAAIGAAIGFLSGLIYMVRCMAEEISNEREMKLREGEPRP